MEDPVIEAYALVAVALLAAGAVVGFLAVVALGSRREEAAHSLTIPAADRDALGARVATRAYARLPE